MSEKQQPGPWLAIEELGGLKIYVRAWNNVVTLERDWAAYVEQGVPGSWVWRASSRPELKFYDGKDAVQYASHQNAMDAADRFLGIAAPPTEWRRVDLFGHTTVYGRVSEAEEFGAKWLRVESFADGDTPVTVTTYNPSAVYSTRPVTEAEARKQTAQARKWTTVTDAPTQPEPWRLLDDTWARREDGAELLVWVRGYGETEPAAVVYPDGRYELRGPLMTPARFTPQHGQAPSVAEAKSKALAWCREVERQMRDDVEIPF